MPKISYTDLVKQTWNSPKATKVFVLKTKVFKVSKFSPKATKFFILNTEASNYSPKATKIFILNTESKGNLEFAEGDDFFLKHWGL